MNAIREIAEKVNVADVIERYGNVKILRGRQFSCPFHGKDENPSAGIGKTNRWHCFACGAGGDAVDFVSSLYHLPPNDAAQMISDDFRLGISLRPVNAEEKKKRDEEWRKWQEEKQQKEEEKVRKERKKEKLLWIYDTYTNILQTWKPKTQEDLDHAPPLWVEAVKNIDYIKCLMEKADLYAYF